MRKIHIIMKLLFKTLFIYILLSTFSNADENTANQYYAQGKYKVAVSEYMILARNRDAQAQYDLGIMYDNGQGVAQDYKQAGEWYRKAAQQGYADAQYNLGVMYDNGKGVAQDYILAHMWSNISAANGYQPAIKNRDIIAKRMTAEQISKAQDMARDWIARTSSKY